MSIKGKAAIAGVYEHPLRWAPHKTQYQIMAESARGALDDAGLKLKDVDGLFTSGGRRHGDHRAGGALEPQSRLS